MIKSKFREISTSLGGEYLFSEKISKSLTTTSHSTDYHKLIIPYNDSEIVVRYEFGNLNIASVNVTTAFRNSPISFSISKRNHLITLFNKKAKSLKVTSDNLNTKLRIEDILLSSGLEKIATDTTFEPEIKLAENDKKIEVSTIFYLGFVEKENSILPIINFYKGIIDLINRN